MRKFLISLGIIILTCTTVFAAKVPDDVKEYINKNVPGSDIRFDGVIILPDNTIYLPLFPSLFTDISNLKVKKSFPEGKQLSQRPDVIIFNNDFVLMKVLSDGQGHRTVLHMTNPPLQIRTGLLPQDMLVPSGLIIPENIKGIIGNLKIDTKNEDIIKNTDKESFEEFIDEPASDFKQTMIPQLAGKTIFITTNYSKNIQVLEPAQKTPKYSLTQKSVPIDMKAVHNGKFLLVTSYQRPYLDIISVADARFIKQIDLGSFLSEILIDSKADRAYVTSPIASTIFVIDLKTMSLIQKIKVNGYCEKLLLTDNKIFYSDKLKGDIWAIETNNEYTLKNIGRFPNISAIAYANNKVYITSRTKSRIAVVDYDTLGLETEYTTTNKPVAMELYGNSIYVLGAQNNELQKLDAQTGKVLETLNLGTGGFSSKFRRIQDSNLAVITDVKNDMYTIVDLNKGQILKTYSVNVPLNDVVITDKVKLFD